MTRRHAMIACLNMDGSNVKLRIAALLTVSMLAGCRTAGDVEGGGVFAIRSNCPVAGVPAGTGDITLFNAPGSSDSRSIDVTATLGYVRSTCQDVGNDVVSTVSFDVVAMRSTPGPARQLFLPYFDVALQAGEKVVAKQVGQVQLYFPAGQMRAYAKGRATIRVNRSVATLPDSAREALTRERKAGEADAAIDPLSDPAVRAAVAQASFEHLVGFQLTDEQIRYNATR
ncbi:MAG TPA: hypothetical protein VNR68_07960 [Sphingomicrobium sp.]|nr:hypothetical protein [Sphingomicrobium sp.]